MKKGTLYCILLNFFIVNFYALSAYSEWTVLVYVQANNNLANFALKNFSDMATIGSNQNLTTVVQWYQPNQQGIWRYKIEKGKMVLDECIPVESDGNASSDLVNSMKWAVNKYPANKYSLVLWNHGIGIIDPLWGKQNKPWNARDNREWAFAIDTSIIQNNPRIQIPDITTESLIIPRSSTLSHDFDWTFTPTQRGILFNEHSRTYMDNENLLKALSDIKTTVLNNRKIDLLGMDACLMAMVEVGYLARNCANFLVASQEVELAHGWNYLALMSSLAASPTSPIDAARNVVQTYEAFYKNKIEFYTQSAINLEQMNTLKTSIDNVINSYRQCQQVDKHEIANLAKNARRSCLQFTASSYIDLHTYFQEFTKQLDLTANQNLKRSNSLMNLRNALNYGMRTIEQSVVAVTAGKNLARAKGLSIYFPFNRIDDSYPRTDFAKDCLWYGFIKEMCGS